MRAGKVTGHLLTEQADEISLTKMMVGRDVALQVKKKEASPQEEILRVEKLRVQNDRKQSAVRDVSFSIRAGEILGIAGVDGNGQTELVEALSGLRRQTAGKIYIKGIDITSEDCLGRRRMVYLIFPPTEWYLASIVNVALRKI